MSADGAVLTFGAPTSELLALRPGDVIVGGIGGAARHGLLRRVVAVSTVNGQVVVTTTGASLSDAVREGRVDTSLALTPDQVESVILAPGVTQVAPGPQALVALPEITLQFDGVPVYDRDSNPFTTDDQVRASGRVTLQLSADLAVDIGRRTADFDVRLKIGRAHV